MQEYRLKNIYTALITPFKDDGSLDSENLKKLIIRQEKSMIDGLVLLSTTGEGSTLETEEAHTILSIAKQNFSRDIIIGIAENDPNKVIKKIRDYNYFKPGAYLICAPFYNKGNEKGIYEFYKSIIDNTNQKIILYNVPSRCGYDIPLNIVKKLSKNKKVIGIKNASYAYKYYLKLASMQNENFKVLCGNDDYFFVGVSLTESGIISVASNLIPNYFSTLYRDFKNNYLKFKEDYFLLDSLFTYLSLDINPIMIKELMATYFPLSDQCRLPLRSVKHYKSKKLLEDLKKNERLLNECYSNW